ncbi:MAG: glycosyltransferase family 2 protein, partial [Candidatus Baltobacteraceae bacterium]
MIVTAILPTYNEERNIGGCLEGLLAQSGVSEFEILVVDGQSRDRTLDVVRSFPEFGTRIRVIENPRRYQVFGWNLGYRAARGEYIAFVSAHALYRRDHFSTCLSALQRTQADAVGAVQVAEGSGTLGRAIAWCMSTPLGIGNARYRYTRREEEAESAFSMFIRRETFGKLGGYDERIAFDEDSEFSYRLRSAGGRIVVAANARVRYMVRGSLRGLSKQMFCYGYWRRFTQLLHPRSLPLRVYAPPALAAALGLSLLALVTPLWAIGAVVPALY